MDFCAIFERDMNALYSLAFLLTGDHNTAEECFLGALEDCRRASDIFRGWMRSWSRRAVVKQAIRQVQPRVEEAAGATEVAGGAEEREEIPRRLLRLPPFQRFVFAMSVLERYSVRECAALLDCQARDVERARVKALQFFGQTATQVRPMAVFAGGGERERPLANAG